MWFWVDRMVMVDARKIRRLARITQQICWTPYHCKYYDVWPQDSGHRIGCFNHRRKSRRFWIWEQKALVYRETTASATLTLNRDSVLSWDQCNGKWTQGVPYRKVVPFSEGPLSEGRQQRWTLLRSDDGYNFLPESAPNFTFFASKYPRRVMRSALYEAWAMINLLISLEYSKVSALGEQMALTVIASYDACSSSSNLKGGISVHLKLIPNSITTSPSWTEFN